MFTSEHTEMIIFRPKYTYVNVREPACGMVVMRPRHRMGRVPRGSGLRAPEPLFFWIREMHGPLRTALASFHKALIVWGTSMQALSPVTWKKNRISD